MGVHVGWGYGSGRKGFIMSPLPSYPSRETRHSPKEPLVQMPAFINRKWPSKAGVSLRLHLSQPGKECPITPIPTPQGSVWKAGPKPKQKTN